MLFFLITWDQRSARQLIHHTKVRAVKRTQAVNRTHSHQSKYSSLKYTSSTYTSSTYGNQRYPNNVLLEQVRLWQEASDAPTEPVLDPSAYSGSLNQRLTQRARSLADEHQLDTTRPARLHRLFAVLAGGLFALLGVLAVFNALDRAGAQINIYWLLLVLLGFNAIALLIWLTATLFGGTEGVIGRLPQWLLGLAPQRHSPDESTPLKQWLGIVYRDKPGKWRISVLTHWLWSCYLAAGLVAMVAVLSVKQYDFYWGSTLLSTEQFSKVVNVLSEPLAAVGLPAPDQLQLDSSRLGSDPGSSRRTLSSSAVDQSTSGGQSAGAGQPASEQQSLRQQWAYFLLSFIILYGLAPRLVALAISWLLLQRAERRFEPDFYLPYYVQLRHQLMPDSGPAVIVDADQAPVATLPDIEHSALDSSLIPAADDFLLLGLELEAALIQQVDLNIDSQHARQQALDLLSTGAPNLALVAHTNVLPDRGVRRVLNTLAAAVPSQKRWLILLDSKQNLDQPFKALQERQEDWFQAAREAKIPIEQVVYTTPEQLRQPNAYRRQGGTNQ